MQNRYELNNSLYMAMRYEKWSIFFILLLVTLIAAVSIVGSLMMLIIEKKGDIATLYAIGAKRSLVRWCRLCADASLAYIPYPVA